MNQGIRRSTRLFMMGAILIASAIGLFTWGANSGLQPASGYSEGDVMARIGQIAGALCGVGAVLWAFGLIQRLRGS